MFQAGVDRTGKEDSWSHKRLDGGQSPILPQPPHSHRSIRVNQPALEMEGKVRSLLGRHTEPKAASPQAKQAASLLLAKSRKQSLG